jgi:hypothetical protein
MNGYQDGVPGYLTIRVTPQDGPIAAFADQEAWAARQRYPHLHGVGVAEYFWARERDLGGWELSEHSGSWPQQARDMLGSHFRLRAKAARDAGDGSAARSWQRAAERMDRAVVDDITVCGERFKVVRVSHFIRSGDSGPEPPRPSDPDPGEVGESHQVPSRTKGFVVDPYIGTGLSDGILKLDLVRFVPVLEGAPEEINEDARRAVRAYPGGVLLPAAYLVSVRRDGGWEYHQPGSTHATPQGARDALAVWLRVAAPVTLRLSEELTEVYAAAADRLDEKRSNTLSVDGHRFRVTRVERLARIGPDGPEGPRPSDFDPEEPVDVQSERLRREGVIDEEGNDLRPLPRPSEQPAPPGPNLRDLWEKEKERVRRLQERRAREAGTPGPEPDTPAG